MTVRTICGCVVHQEFSPAAHNCRECVSEYEAQQAHIQAVMEADADAWEREAAAHFAANPSHRR